MTLAFWNEECSSSHWGETVFGTVAYVTSDNLAAHTLGGFNESFSPNVNKFCRFSYADYADISDVTKTIVILFPSFLSTY